jgi:Flp pilus assembly protein TadG
MRIGRAPRKRAGRRRGRGQSLVEFAIVLPVLILIMLGAVDFGRVFFTWIEVTNSSREGAA